MHTQAKFAGGDIAAICLAAVMTLTPLAMAAWGGIDPEAAKQTTTDTGAAAPIPPGPAPAAPAPTPTR